MIFFSKCVVGQIIPSTHLLFVRKSIVDESKFIFTNTITHIQAISDSLIIVWGYPSNTGLYNYQTGKINHVYTFNQVNIDSIIDKIIQPVFSERKYLTGKDRKKETTEYPATEVDWFWVGGTEIVWHVNFLTPYIENYFDKNFSKKEALNIQYTSSLITTNFQGHIKKMKWFAGKDELSCGFFLCNGYYSRNNILWALNDSHFDFMSQFQKHDLTKEFKFIALRDYNKNVVIDTTLSKKFLPIENKVSYRYWSLRMLMSNNDTLIGDGIGIYNSENLFPIKDSFYEKLNNRTFLAFRAFNEYNNILFQASDFKILNGKEIITYQLVNYDFKNDKIVWEENIGDGTMISQFAFWKNNLIYIQKNGDHYEFIQNRIIY